MRQPLPNIQQRAVSVLTTNIYLWFGKYKERMLFYSYATFEKGNLIKTDKVFLLFLVLS